MLLKAQAAAGKASSREMMKRARTCRRLAGQSVTPHAARELEKLAARYEALARIAADLDPQRPSSRAHGPRLAAAIVSS